MPEFAPQSTTDGGQAQPMTDQRKKVAMLLGIVGVLLLLMRYRKKVKAKARAAYYAGKRRASAAGRTYRAYRYRYTGRPPYKGWRKW